MGRGLAVRGDIDARWSMAFWLDGRLVATLTANEHGSSSRWAARSERGPSSIHVVRGS